MMNGYGANCHHIELQQLLEKICVAIFGNHLGHGIKIHSFDALDDLEWNP